MKTFGELLREHIEKSGFTIYQFARVSGVNRVSIQRYLAGQRFPSPDVFETLRSCLQLQPLERQELDTSYEMSRIGKPLYFQRLAAKELIESITLVCDSENQIMACSGDSMAAVPPLPPPSSKNIHSPRKTQCAPPVSGGTGPDGPLRGIPRLMPFPSPGAGKYLFESLPGGHRPLPKPGSPDHPGFPYVQTAAWLRQRPPQFKCAVCCPPAQPFHALSLPGLFLL